MLQRTVEPLTKLEPIPDWWLPLFSKAARPSIFLSAAWMQGWLNIYGSDFEGQWVSWSVDGQTVGGCLMLTREVRDQIFSFRCVYFNASAHAAERTPFVEFNDVLFVSQYCNEIAEDLANLVDCQPWDRIYLSGYQPGGVLHRLAHALPYSASKHDEQVSSYVDFAIARNGDFKTCLSANTRSQILRSQRHYENRFGLLHLHRAASVTEAIEQLSQLAIFHNKRRLAKGDSGTFQSRPVLQFHQSLIVSLFSRQQVDLLRLDAGTTPIGYLYNFVLNGKVYFFQSGFDQ